MAFHCGRNFLFTVLTLLTIGVSLAVFAAMLYYFDQIAIKQVAEDLFVGVVIGLCLSVLLLIYGFYASCCGNRCHKCLLSVFYLIFSITLGAVGVALLAVKGKIEEGLAKLWETGQTQVTSALEDGFKCISWDNHSIAESERCRTKIMNFYSKYGNIGGGCLIALFVVLMAGTVLAFRFVCKSEPKSDKASSTQPNGKDQFTTPLTYGW